MGELQIVATLLMIAIILVVVLMLCHSLDIWPRLTAWIFSNTEEKIGLTKLKGLYNANGYLVRSTSDLKLFASGSFKRFDSVDRDFRETLVTTNLTEKWKAGDENNPMPPPFTLQPSATSNTLSKDSTIPILKTSTGENSFLFVSILEAKELLGSNKEDILLDTYVRVFLLPDKISNAQTKIYKDSRNPSYKERFLFELHPREQCQKSLCFQVYSTSNLSHTLIGEGEFKLNDASLRQPVTTWVTLTDTGQRTSEFGEIFFSLSYLPTAERLTVVVVKARHLKFQNEREAGDPFVKVYLLQNGKKVSKKKTTTKKGERCPIFNESIIFNVPAHVLQTIQLRLTVSEAISNENNSSQSVVGHVIVGAQATGRPLTHWTQMLATLRKPVAMWHPLRK
ncbi:synaptotagmin-12 [Agrilus planipennis]|uniref:Synaptotagmin-12 n=1 Tax=Agrilus planipennis TaxID=224129 RepID=A0A1W4WQE6_AGRPL|nr:synaptotagmin-12 [Agrilus planipennis]